ncbi:MAG: hypothetical protein NTX55_00020 [Candidatus Parcubacteria bacterium]|nr:hypothetical protein [Candidatus Parcubacteria bacterium]
MDINKIFSASWRTKKFKIVMSIIGSIIVLLLVFAAGTIVGFKKANFSFRWAENYHQNFGGPRGGFFGQINGRDFIDAHGVFGQIIKIDGSTIVINGRDNMEKIILTTDKTVINGPQMKVNDYIVVIGDPNNAGQIEAKLIRLMPAMPMMKR